MAQMLTLHRPKYEYLGNIISYLGPIRNGKSLLAIFHAILAIEDFRLERLVCNFEVNIDGLLAATRFYFLPYAYSVFAAGEVYFVRDVSDFLKFKNAVLIVDECGIYLNSRDWAENKGFFKFLPQIGKSAINCHCFLIAQYIDQIDFSAQQMVEYCWCIESVKTYDLKLKMPRLIKFKGKLMPISAMGERNSRKSARQKLREALLLCKKRLNFKPEYLAPVFEIYSSGAEVSGVPEKGYFKKSKGVWQIEVPSVPVAIPNKFYFGFILHVLALRFGIINNLHLNKSLKLIWKVEEWNFFICCLFTVLMANIILICTRFLF
jgi:hypothetical protein